MSKVIIAGSEVDFDGAVILMDDELREALNDQCAGAVAWKYADPSEDARWVHDENDLAEIRAQDPSLIKDVNQAFVDLYCEAHQKKFGEEFRVN